MAHSEVDFNNTKVAFHLKSDAELERAYFLFKMIANEPLVRIGTAATNFALKTHLPVEGLIRATVFDHFCGGVSAKDCMPKIDQMFRSGVYSILDYSVEESMKKRNLIVYWSRFVRLLILLTRKLQCLLQYLNRLL